MSFTESSETEAAQLNKHFPERSAEEIKKAIEHAKETFHGSRGGNRTEILARMLD